ncbi:MAG: hypothetical protein ACREEK_26460 [Bradyrhizobium sp.]
MASRLVQGASLGGTATVGFRPAPVKFGDPFQVMRAIELELVRPGRDSGFHRSQLAVPKTDCKPRNAGLIVFMIFYHLFVFERLLG